MNAILCATILGAMVWAAGALAQPAPADLKPGLDALYLDGDYRHIERMPTGANLIKQGSRKVPVAKLDEISPTGEILNAGRVELYGIHMTGFLNLPAGETALAVNSNDGVRVALNGKTILDDPDVHPDRMSLPVMVRQATAGWVPITIQYFQRKNTAALQLFWQKPGAANMEIVPAEAFGHIPPK